MAIFMAGMRLCYTLESLPSSLTTKSSACRFDNWYPNTILCGVTWLQVVDGELRGGRKRETTRTDVIRWDAHGIPGGPLSHAI